LSGAHHISRGAAGACLLLTALFLPACGSSKKSTSTGSSSSSSQGTLALSITESGGAARYTGPTSIKGGLVTMTLKNEGKQPHTAQLVLLKGNHTAADALKEIEGNSNKTPSWLRAAGGVGLTPPGQSSSSTVLLAAGHYAVLEIPSGAGPPSGKPAVQDLQVTAGSPGSLPSTATTVTAAAEGKDKYKWQISGSLAPGANRVTFASKGHDTLHLITAVQITGNPSKEQLIKALSSNGPPPAFVKVQTSTETAALDSGQSTVAQLNLAGPGRYLLFCPLTDRDGGKPHFQEGLLTTVTVK